MARRQAAQDEAWWSGLVAAYSAQQDSVSVAAFCTARRITVSQFQYQRRKALARQLAAPRSLEPRAQPAASTPAFREYALPAVVPAEPAAGCGIRLHLREVVIELSSGFDPEALRQVLSCCR